MNPIRDQRLDPICGMWLKPEQTVMTYTYLGVTYAFCARECYETFARTPERMIALLAHEPRGHCGYLCPGQRQASGTTWPR